jgi:hypothetical protein
MGYTFYDDTNTLVICTRTGMSIQRIFNKANEDEGQTFDNTKYNWISGSLVTGGGTVTKTYDVYFSSDHPKFKYLIKVNQKYNEKEFEDIFGLGTKCRWWSPNTIIGVH